MVWSGHTSAWLVELEIIKLFWWHSLTIFFNLTCGVKLLLLLVLNNLISLTMQYFTSVIKTTHICCWVLESVRKWVLFLNFIWLLIFSISLRIKVCSEIWKSVSWQLARWFPLLIHKLTLSKQLQSKNIWSHRLYFYIKIL